MATTTRAWRRAAAGAGAPACLGTVAVALAVPAPARAASRLTLAIGSLQFAVQEIGTTSPAQAVTLTAAPGDDLHVTTLRVTGPYTLVSDCAASGADAATIAAGDSCDVHVTFTPTGLGHGRGSLVIVSDGGSRTLPMDGIGSVRAPIVAFDEGGLEFSPQKVGTRSNPQLLTVRNVGNATLHAGSIAARGAFTASPAGCPTTGGDVLTLNPGGSCVLNVTFSPAAAAPGRAAGQVEIVSNAPGAALQLPVAGLGVHNAPAIAFDAASLHFAFQRVGTTSDPQTVRLSNSGRATLHVASLAASDGFDARAARGCRADAGDAITLDPGESCAIAVTFSPSPPSGVVTGSLRLASDAPGGVYTLALEGLGTGGPVQAGAGAAGGGYVLVPGAPADVEAYRERLDFALRVNADGTVRGKQLTFRFSSAGTAYVVRSTDIDRFSLVVTGKGAVFSGRAVVARVAPGGAETALPGVYPFAAAMADVAEPGAGYDTFSIVITAPDGSRFHALGAPRAQLRLASGNLGVRTS